jgi:hypothetical protein
MAVLQLDKAVQYLDPAKTDWIIEQAERRLKHLHDAGETVDKKAQLLLNVCIGLLTGITAFIVGHWDANKTLWENVRITGALWLSAAIIIAAGFKLLVNIKTEYFTPLGTRPASMLHPEFVPNDLPTMKRGYLTELERRISADEITHDNRCDRVDFAARALGLGSLAAFLLEIVLLITR